MRSKGRRFLYLEDVSFTYPGGDQAAVRRATVECSMRSRVAVLGPNGAGKSTVAGLVVGELAPEGGQAWRHPNLRMAYVAQHAFHHLEEHLELTASESLGPKASKGLSLRYILWRFQGNEDREVWLRWRQSFLARRWRIVRKRRNVRSRRRRAPGFGFVFEAFEAFLAPNMSSLVRFRLLEDRLVQCEAGDPQALEPEMIVDRRQRGRLGYEYEMSWRGRP